MKQSWDGRVRAHSTADWLQGWREADVGWPFIVGSLVAMTAVFLGGAGLGGRGGVAIIVIAMVSVIGLLYVWSAVAPRQTSATIGRRRGQSAARLACLRRCQGYFSGGGSADRQASCGIGGDHARQSGATGLPDAERPKSLRNLDGWHRSG
jgi:hypothetical protein